jgi:diaminopimelate decarboxylase
MKICIYQKVKRHTFRDLAISISIRGIQINSLDQLHVVQQRVKRHEEGKADSVTT